MAARTRAVDLPPPFRGRLRESRPRMSILIGKNTKAICQGFTGKNGAFHCERATGWHPVGGLIYCTVTHKLCNPQP